MMKWLREWNRGRYDLGLGHLSRTEPSRDKNRHAFEKFYKGWRDYMEADRCSRRPTGMKPPAVVPLGL